ncbi:MAG: IS481 family transposase, partial [Puniceicoccales bacterium]|nr:IS481 family transposase [Puniceicoccales bacterium]
MNIALHKNARTTPAIRAEIAASKDSVAVLAARYGVGQRTIRRWRSREVFTDASHTAHRLQTTLTPAQEAVAVELRKCLLLPL